MLAVAKFFKGKDWAGDGRPDDHNSFVTSITRGNQAFWYAYSWFSAYGVMPTDKSPAAGIFIFNPEDMTPLVNNPGYVKAIEKYKEMVDCCIRPGKDSVRGDVINEMINGTTLMALDWGDIGPSSVGKDSVVKGKLGFALAPGSKEYYDWKSKGWVKSAEVKYSPTHAFNGWAFMITKTSKNPQAAWDLRQGCIPLSGLATSTPLMSGLIINLTKSHAACGFLEVLVIIKAHPLKACVGEYLTSADFTHPFVFQS